MAPRALGRRLRGVVAAVAAARRRDRARDVLVAVVFAVLAATASYSGARWIDATILTVETIDSWFEADIARVAHHMSNRWGGHHRVTVHPLFPLFTFTPVYGLRLGLGLQPLTAVRVVIAAVAGLWAATLFGLLRLLGCRRLDAVLFTLLGASSAAAVFWFVVPETYSFGSWSILVALFVVALAERRAVPTAAHVCASALTMSFTITNWMAGILATLVSFPWRRALQVTVNAFCLVVVLWGVQKTIVPAAPFFLGDNFIGDRTEQQFLLMPESGGPLVVATSFVFHAMLMPSIQLAPANLRGWPRMTVQTSPPGSGSGWGPITAVLWLALLGAGGMGRRLADAARAPAPRARGHSGGAAPAPRRVRARDVSLCAPPGPLLVVLAALGTLTPARPLVLALALLTTLGAAANNLSQLVKANQFYQTQGPPRPATPPGEAR